MAKLLNTKSVHNLLKIPKWIDTRLHVDVCIGCTRIYKCFVEESSVRGKTFIAIVLVGQVKIRCVFFHFGAFIQSNIKSSENILLEGKVSYSQMDGMLEMAQPAIKDQKDENIGRYYPKYSEKINIDKIISDSLLITRGEYMIGASNKIMQRYGLFTEEMLIRKIHLDGFYPQEKMIVEHSIACLESYRLAFSLFESVVSKRKTSLKNIDTGGTIVQFESNHHFKLTGDQRRGLFQIHNSLLGKTTSGIMVSGDVGSGKSILAALAIQTVMNAGYAAIVMQPNAILTTQFAETCVMAGIKDIQIITGSSKEKPSAACVIGTQALLHRKYAGSRKVALIVIDEIQKFGAAQFNSLFERYDAARCLSMTATLMPRSIMRDRIGGLQTVILKETPKPRVVHTRVTTDGDEVRSFVQKIAHQKGEIIYLVHPSIDSNTMANVQRTVAKLKEWKSNGMLPLYADIFPLHGKMSDDEKNKVISSFKNLSSERSGIVVATSLIETGIDHDKSNAIVILEGAAHGLSALHQLRGRVGRHGKEGYCLIFTSNQNCLAKLKAFALTNDGFTVAEMDMENRGYGELIGNLQSGKDLMQLDLNNSVHQGYLNDAISQYSKPC